MTPTESQEPQPAEGALAEPAGEVVDGPQPGPSPQEEAASRQVQEKREEALQEHREMVRQASAENAGDENEVVDDDNDEE